MKLIYKIFAVLTIVACHLSITDCYAQPEHEFSYHNGAGLSTLHYNSSVGKQTDGFGGFLGLKYSYHYYDHWAAVTGTDVSLLSSRMKIDPISEHYSAIDPEGTRFDFRSKLENHEEVQTVIMLTIPLMMQYEIIEKYGWYLAAGTKVCFPLKSTFRIQSANLTTSGYYAKEDWEYKDQYFVGFGYFSREPEEGKLHFKPVVLAALETGLKMKIDDRFFLYVGVYFDYGLDNMLNSGRNKHLVEYNAAYPKILLTNSVLESSYTQDDRTHAITDKLSLMSVGAKLAVSFGLGKSKGGKRFLPGSWKPTRRGFQR
jgi:hypothetical protein